mmetsp:Transcript_19595/g.32126  ORF Transcript_19595/g.32126 Transcript_19595/m.32126 type:complete len:581 (-) Transcript_19595:506-2248(-)|eukprot:CAMPEP_0184335512 /NCGR_PEP_ID=MMETSP1089-20130417/4070_1 /TAXON_ID=38269 ORGANISM="Gloeochaete wittrockiana, Strain SAG46.84" /NCGR_SAMPLE_ID=MMETSP1089 /ASSEMBLY_ACC=CAM_ASM_000445 /LENGTH=580 /DNA_ID=CAMNT_0026660211 /DNA_START=50 /DNA_END=1792 /DNA_ORIENTATION=+
MAEMEEAMLYDNGEPVDQTDLFSLRRSTAKVCALCHEDTLHAAWRTNCGKWVHALCAIALMGLGNEALTIDYMGNGRVLVFGLDRLNHDRCNLKCQLCKERGALPQCNGGKCWYAWHPYCAVENKCALLVLKEKAAQFLLFCKKHMFSKDEHRKWPKLKELADAIKQKKEKKDGSAETDYVTGEDEEERCDVCQESSLGGPNLLAQCAGCLLWVHLDCYGIRALPGGQWLCDSCFYETDPTAFDEEVVRFGSGSRTAKPNRIRLTFRLPEQSNHVAPSNHTLSTPLPSSQQKSSSKREPHQQHRRQHQQQPQLKEEDQSLPALPTANGTTPAESEEHTVLRRTKRQRVPAVSYYSDEEPANDSDSSNERIRGKRRPARHSEPAKSLSANLAKSKSKQSNYMEIPQSSAPQPGGFDQVQVSQIAFPHLTSHSTPSYTWQPPSASLPTEGSVSDELCLLSVTCLDLSGKGLTELSGLGRLCNVEELHLRNNKITSLQSFPPNLPLLRVLGLEFNQIEDPWQLRCICSCMSLRILRLNGNKCTEKPDYRIIVLRCAPGLISLDDQMISQEERDIAQMAPPIQR